MTVFCCRFKEYISNRSIGELIAEEEVVKSRDLLRQARLSELAAQQEAKAAAASQAKEQEDIKTETTSAVKSENQGADGAVAMEVDEPSAIVRENENGTQPSAMKNDAQAAEEAQIKLESEVKNEPIEQVNVDADMKQENSAQSADVTDEDVKAYWLSGIAALYQV